MKSIERSPSDSKNMTLESSIEVVLYKPIEQRLKEMGGPIQEQKLLRRVLNQSPKIKKLKLSKREKILRSRDKKMTIDEPLTKV